MYPASCRTFAAALLAIGLLHACTPPGYAHGGGGGGGHGSGGSGGGGHSAASRGGGVGYQYSGPRHDSSWRGFGRSYVADSSRAPLSGVGWPSFPEDLPFNRLHHFLVGHRPHWNLGGSQHPAQGTGSSHPSA